MTDDERLKVQRELLVLEYEHCVERYENIYKALWQNFNYLSLLAAAVLTFGTTKFAWHLAASLAGIPLFFWYLIQFWPLDLYGRRVRARTAEIERTLNHLFFERRDGSYEEFTFQNKNADSRRIRVSLAHYDKFYPSQSKGTVITRWCSGIGRLFKRFWKFLTHEQWGPGDEIVPIRTRMHVAFFLIFLFWLYPALLTVGKLRSGGVNSMVKDSSSYQEVKLSAGGTEASVRMNKEPSR